MSTETIPALQQAAVREALETTAERFVEVLRAASAGDARAVGDWSVAQVAAHVGATVALDIYAATGELVAPALADLIEKGNEAGAIDDVGVINNLALEREPERDLALLADRVTERVAYLLDATATLDGAERVRWLGDATLTVTGILAHLLEELLVHGFDIAQTDKQPWSIPSPAVAPVFDLFLMDLASNLHAFEPATADPKRGRFAIEFRLAGTTPVVLVYDGTQLTTQEPGRRVDVRVSGDPAVLLLVMMMERIGRLGPLLRRQVTVFGPRPWRLRLLEQFMP